MKVKKNDTVQVIAGKDSGKQGKVLAANPKANRVTVDGINIQKRHTKARGAKQVSEIKLQSGAIDASNVLVVCPKCNKPTRIGYTVTADAKFRTCKKCGANLDVKEVVKTDKKEATKKPRAKKADAAPAAEEK